ncbi:hypothetical protein [Pandoraea pnomenusa]|uniref:hypothetical protein n=1 Tax=Pandoraea pnomenusa TaxID=93220 RepID=UPI00114650BC|nr:hypothetical protein [Pandoraea pnomenusa]QDH61615.1 hypothetical protein FKQ53_21790 [Pandoraea pnomenusa]
MMAGINGNASPDLLTWYTSLQEAVHGMGKCIDLMRPNPMYEDLAAMLGVFYERLDHLVVEGFPAVMEVL